MYFDESGALNVFLTAAGDPSAVPAQLISFFSPNGEEGAAHELVSRARIRRAAFEFRELHAWHQAFKSAGVLPGVTMLDVDDATNRFSIGIESEATSPAIRKHLDEIGIPQEAVSIEIVGRPQLTQALNQLYTPRIAGLQVNTNNGNVGAVRDSACTLGFLAFGPNYPSMYVVTNSHCTNARWASTGDWLGQPYQSDTIGYEVADPPLFNSTSDSRCPSYNQATGLPVLCRYSDAAVILGTEHINPTWHGTIAGTVGSNLTIQDSWTITSTTIVGTGWQVYKVGRTTGTTGGLTRRVCADVWHSPHGIHDVFLLCQGAADFHAADGDSGSPVFASDPFSSGYGHYRPVMLQGIYWGKALKTSTTYEPYRWYSYTIEMLFELSPYVGGALDPIRR